MRRVLFTLLVAGWACFGLAQGTSAIKFPSPDGRFALRVADLEVDLIEMTTGKVMVDLGTLWINRDDESDRTRNAGRGAWLRKQNSSGQHKNL